MRELEQLTVGEVLRRAAKKFPERPALETSERVLTYKELDYEVDRAARCLLKWGVKRGDHLGIWCEAEIQTVIVMYAAVRIGAVTALINTSLSRKEMKGIVERTDIKWMIIGKSWQSLSYGEMCQGLVEEVPLLEGIIYSGMEEGAYGFPSLGNFVDEMVSEEELRQVENSVTPEDSAYIIFTSGTTSFPKAVMGTHFSRSNMSIQQVSDMEITEHDKICSALPLFHCFGLSANMITACTAGACLCLPHSRKTLDVLTAISKFRCTILSAVPSMFAAIIRREDFAQWDVSCLRTGIIGGAKYSLELFNEIEEKIGMTLTACFGMSEATCGITSTKFSDPLEIRPSSGVCFDHTEVKIVDPTTGESLPAGKAGEVCTRGYHVMQGYYKQPEETAKTIDKDQWLHTGDMGYIDEQGNLIINGRLKEMIIRGGENISPAEIENVVTEDENVVMCKAVGVPDDFYGEAVCLCVVLEKGVAPDEAALRARLEARLAYFKVPKYILYLDALPCTPTGKIRLGEVKVLAKEILGL